MITSKEALDISLKNNSDVKSILSTIELYLWKVKLKQIG